MYDVAGDLVTTGIINAAASSGLSCCSSRSSPDHVLAIVEAIVRRHREMMFAQRTRIAVSNRFAAYIRVRVLGVSNFDGKEALAKAAREIARIRKILDADMEAARKAQRALDKARAKPRVRRETILRLEKALAEVPRTPLGLPGGFGAEDEAALRALSVGVAQAAAPFEEFEAGRRKMMERMAATLPGADFVRSVRGFGMLSFATLVGEAGDIGSYRSHITLWKRLGLTVIHGERQQKKTNAILAEAHGYNPKRRAAAWTVFDTLFRGQSGLEGEVGKTGRPRVPREPGPYRLVYDREKAKALAKEWPLYIAHPHARRVAGKAAVRHLYQAWRRDLRAPAADIEGDRHPDVRRADRGPFVSLDPIARDQSPPVLFEDQTRSVAGDLLDAAA